MFGILLLPLQPKNKNLIFSIESPLREKGTSRVLNFRF